jgi:HSP20 family molecular chaperone IbpA
VVDIYSNGRHELVLKAELPDMKEEEIGLTVEDNTLTLSGEKKPTRKSPSSSSIASSAVMARSRGRSRCRRRSTLARSAPSTRPVC